MVISTITVFISILHVVFEGNFEPQRSALNFKDCYDKNSRRVEQEATQQIILAEFTQTTSNVPSLPATPVYPVAEQPPSYESITTIDR